MAFPLAEFLLLGNPSSFCINFHSALLIIYRFITAVSVFPVDNLLLTPPKDFGTQGRSNVVTTDERVSGGPEPSRALKTIIILEKEY